MDEIVCFAMTAGPRDRQRMIAWQLLFPKHKIVAVSESADVCEEYEVRNHNFSTLRGFAASITKSTMCIVLDWFWLQTRYYAERYGMLWVRSFVPYAFNYCPKLEVIILPFESWSALGGGMDEMMSNDADALIAHGIKAKRMTWKQANRMHPLVMATNESGLEKSVMDAEKRHVDSEFPFVIFVKY